jgi:hypothetical protein
MDVDLDANDVFKPETMNDEQLLLGYDFVCGRLLLKAVDADSVARVKNRRNELRFELLRRMSAAREG